MAATVTPCNAASERKCQNAGRFQRQDPRAIRLPSTLSRHHAEMLPSHTTYLLGSSVASTSHLPKGALGPELSGDQHGRYK